MNQTVFACLKPYASRSGGLAREPDGRRTLRLLPCGTGHLPRYTRFLSRSRTRKVLERGSVENGARPIPPSHQ
jgi:hypothetical protein